MDKSYPIFLLSVLGQRKHGVHSLLLGILQLWFFSLVALSFQFFTLPPTLTSVAFKVQLFSSFPL